MFTPHECKLLGILNNFPKCHGDLRQTGRAQRVYHRRDIVWYLAQASYQTSDLGHAVYWELWT